MVRPMSVLSFILLSGCLGLDQKGLSDTADSGYGDLPGDEGDPGSTALDTSPDPIDDTGDGNFDENSAPVADAGDDVTVEAGSVVNLDGSESYDPDDDYITYYWEILSLPAGSTASLINEDRENPQIYVDLEGDYELVLTVSDGALESEDTVIVEVFQPNEEPVAIAGPDQSVTEGSTVILDGTGSYDPNDDALTFFWEFTAIPSGSAAGLSDATSPAPRFTADGSGTYEITLVVSDGEYTSSPDSVRVTSSGSGGGPGGGGTTGGGGGSSSCLSCSEPTQQYLMRHRSFLGLASGPGLVFLPLAAFFYRRKKALS